MVRSHIVEYDCHLQAVHVGQDMNSLFHVPDTSIPVVAVINPFGRFLCYDVTLSECQSASEQSTSQTAAVSLIFVQPVNNVRTKKHKLYNDLTNLFLSHSASFTDSELEMAKKFVSLLRDILWYVDGHHHVFDQRASPIPRLFESFIGYNLPELSKHCKRLTRNISSDALRQFALDLSNYLHFSFWDMVRVEMCLS